MDWSQTLWIIPDGIKIIDALPNSGNSAIALVVGKSASLWTPGNLSSRIRIIVCRVGWQTVIFFR
ncbi:MAG: hypothetical protein PHH01_02420 [Patescibacteria group bacterium]|nr:hypothetical protein [Patescibacteria group bacterium]